ncbi:two-component system response regulator [candidate division KSB3 bacterium]|uniref:Two-component system response regulator n=1 Tax=candidate division KSB3 bacterium TaxID=2044937 RepID=A0A2G6E224_9BACT|nr:MAG: two-component system response regulator [candidate division KSB3 bacterium]PIE30323.1 MAG: two-component system response regulator [candidate division KSB3 bacterium]
MLKKNGTPFTYLIVDDSRFARSSLVRLVEQIGGEVIGEAASGAEALERHAALKPDVVTMDLSLPDVDGIILLRKMISIYPDALIILSSGISHEEVIEEALRAGGEHFISKPLDVEKAKNIIEWVIRASGK